MAMPERTLEEKRRFQMDQVTRVKEQVPEVTLKPADMVEVGDSLIVQKHGPNYMDQAPQYTTAPIAETRTVVQHHFRITGTDDWIMFDPEVNMAMIVEQGAPDEQPR